MNAQQVLLGGDEHYYEQSLPVLQSRPPTSTTWLAPDPTAHPGAYHVASRSANFAPPIPPTGMTAPQPSVAQTAQRPDLESVLPAATTSTSGGQCNVPSKVQKSRKAASDSAGKSTLFWVNSDPKTATAKSKEETLKRIRSHVMSEHNRKKRLENTNKYKTQTWKHTAFQRPETNRRAMGPARPSSSSVSSSGNRRGVYAVDQSGPQLQLGTVVTTAGEYHPAISAELWDGRFDEPYDEVIEYAARAAAPSVWTYVGSGTQDPFNAGHTQITDRMMRYLNNCEWLARQHLELIAD